MKKCLKSISGKHIWNHKEGTVEVRREKVFTLENNGNTKVTKDLIIYYPNCSACGLVNDQKEFTFIVSEDRKWIGEIDRPHFNFFETQSYSVNTETGETKKESMYFD